MHFRKIAGKNFGPFESFEYDLVRGSIGMFGVNGKGKSTLFNALYALLSNDFSRYDGLKTDRVRSNAEPKAKSYLYAEVEHEGRVLAITRGIQSMKSEMSIDGAKSILGDAKIDEELKIMGIDKKILDLYVFKPQDKIFDFLLSTPTERAKAFAVLCRTAHCQKIWQAIRDHINKDSDVNTQIADNSDELLQDIGGLEARGKELQASREEEAPHLLNGKSLESAQTILKKRDRLAQLKEDLDRAEGRGPNLKTVLREQKEACEEAASKLDKVETKLKDGKAEVISARLALKSMKQYRKYREQKEELEAEKTRLAKRSFSSPEVPKGYKEGIVQELRDELADKQQKLKTAKDSVSKGICQTCKRPFGDANELQRQKTIVDTLPAAIETIIERGQKFKKYEEALLAHSESVAEHGRAVKGNKKAIADLAEMDAPEGDEAELKKLVEDYEAREERVVGLRQKANDTAQAKAKAEEALAGNRRRVDEINAAMEENAVDPELAEKAERRLAEHTAATENIARIDGEAKGILGQIASKNKDLETLRTRLERTKKVRRLARVADQLCDLFDPKDGLPKDVAQENLVEMEYDINEGLKIFGDPFWVEASDDLSFIVHPPDKPPHPAGWLSTGQRVVLALAFWPAVASLWSNDLGILGLDEPTANLDAANRRYLADALGQMTAKVRGKRQVFVVTHDPDLRSAFDQVIDLG